MSTAGMKVLFVGRSWDVPYEVRICATTARLMLTIAEFRPDVIVTSDLWPGNLQTAGFELRKRWIHIENPEATPQEVISSIEECYYATLWKHPNEDHPEHVLVSIYTGAYNTGDVLFETYASLREQTYPNWEWVVVDDGSTDDTWRRLLALAKEDYRVRPFQALHIGKIGNTKDIATRLCNGKYLVELDHDDMLTDTAVEDVKNVFESDPTVGMVYTNCAAFYPDGSPHVYTDEFWGQRYRDTEYRGKVYKECVNPDIYDRFGPEFHQQFAYFLTVGPNHIRAYRTETLRQLGGYNRNLLVADDWEVYARFFLYSKCYHLDKMLYLYRFHDGWSNTTFTRNEAIQDHLELGRRWHAAEFDRVNQERLGVTAAVDAQLSILLLDWNTEKLTHNCIESIRQHYPRAQIILGFTGAPYKEPLADVTLDLELNLWYSGGMNRLAVEADREFVCILNNDTIIEAGFFERMVGELRQHPDVGVVGPYVSYGRPPQGNCPKEAMADAPERVDLQSVAGICLLMRRQLFEEIGGFDPRFRSSDDDDLCIRLINRGYKCRVVNAWLEHIGHASYKKNDEVVEEVIQKDFGTLHEKWPRVKAVAITFNERQALPGWVEQLHKAGIHDISILDSGSTDGTCDWARANGVRIGQRGFDDFSTQRNAALERFAQDTEWVIMYDPDERLDDNTLSHIWDLAANKQYDSFLTSLHDSNGIEWVAKPFMFRADKGLHWVRPVHEKLVGSARQALIMNALNTHMLPLHDPERRQRMQEEYDVLGKDAEETELEGTPILTYKHPHDDRIDQVWLGPKVSVVIPTYRRLGLLRKAVESAVAQDWLNKEIIVVGDNCPALLPKELPFTCFNDRQVPVIVRNLPRNHGAGGAVPRNYAIMLAGGAWIAYLDDDNEWKPNHVSSVMMAIYEIQADLGVSSMEVGGVPLIFKDIAQGSFDTSCLIHRRALVKQFGWWKDRTEVGYDHDWEFVSRYVTANLRRAITCEPTVKYNKDTSGQKEYLEQRIAEVTG